MVINMQNKFRKKAGLTAALVLGGSLALGGCGDSPKQSDTAVSAVVVDMEQAQTGDLTLQNSFVGIVSPQELVYVIPLASGTVSETFFEVGDQVNAGDVLFKIDDSTAQLQLAQAQLNATSARQQASSALGTQQESANIQLDGSAIQAQSGFEQAQIQYVNLKDNYDKVNDAISDLDDIVEELEGAIALTSVSSGDAATVQAAVKGLQEQLKAVKAQRSELQSTADTLKPQVQAAASAYRAAEESLSITDRTKALTQGAALNDTRAQLSTSLQLADLGVDSAELALSYYTVTAPISGTIESKGVEVNGLVGGSSPAYVIANENTMTVTFQVSEAVKNVLTVGQGVTVERGGVTFDGNITEIGVAVNQQTGLFQVKAAVNADGDSLPSGVSVKLSTDTYRTSGAVLIPYDSVYYDSDGAYVYLYMNGHAAKTYVETGIFDDTTIAVTEGLQQGDTVITSWSPRLIDGAEVTAASGAE